ncbi:GNAT family N-acetyltransferase [Gilvimarinus sp. 1_MG-2023]|uniref:GNAT family N-acetyltransferase n=1 Tax=Gilvimarinus sp. 1_MG-2023 TaxID=3062638 RepID=UPI0026E3F9E5|nr:GNAT family N-acetyltransferase [Gilvimarinus sp. 1_MG-2023]MDO6745636.1 GNAT family N-acetyltransferase [Gilvimarinus sp. 1_MG-2023]
MTYSRQDKSNDQRSAFKSYLVDWPKSSRALSDIRHQVFILEQGVSSEEEWDGKDENAWHFAVKDYRKDPSELIGCARIIEETWHGEKGLHIGRVAVLKPWRGRGAGLQLMHAMLYWCAQRANSHRTVFLHAQIEALGFYQRLGFQCVGPEFIDAGIPHRTMVLSKSTVNMGAENANELSS